MSLHHLRKTKKTLKKALVYVTSLPLVPIGTLEKYVDMDLWCGNIGPVPRLQLKHPHSRIDVCKTPISQDTNLSLDPIEKGTTIKPKLLQQP